MRDRSEDPGLAFMPVAYRKRDKSGGTKAGSKEKRKSSKKIASNYREEPLLILLFSSSAYNSSLRFDVLASFIDLHSLGT